MLVGSLVSWLCSCVWGMFSVFGRCLVVYFCVDCVLSRMVLFGSVLRLCLC